MSAKTEALTRIIGADGNLDADALADLGESWILSWLRERLAGKDPYSPLDRRYDEDPDAKVVDLLRSAGPLHPASRSIGRASLRLLMEAAKRPAEPPAFLASLLRVCQQVRLPDTEPWFFAFVDKLAEDPRERFLIL